MPLPENKFISSLTLPVRFNEVDSMNIVHHSQYVVYFEEGRLQYAAQLGVPFHEVMNAGFALAVTELQIAYKQPLTLGQTFTVQCWQEGLTTRTLKYGCEIQRVSGGPQEVIATAAISLICLSATGRPARIPEPFYGRLVAAFQGTLP